MSFLVYCVLKITKINLDSNEILDAKPFLLFYFHSLHYMITLCITDLHVSQPVSNELHFLIGGRKGVGFHSDEQSGFLLSSPVFTGGMCLQLEQALQRYSMKQTACASLLACFNSGVTLPALRRSLFYSLEIIVLLLGLPVGTIRMCAR